MDLGTLLERAEKLVPEIRARGAESDASCRLPDASVRDLVEAGLPRATQPREYGGAALGAEAQIALSATLGRGCMSTAWCQFVWSAHNFLLRAYPEAAQRDVWTADATALIAASLGPVGRATSVPGGFRLTGHWKFASGCDAADWLMLGAVDASAEQPRPLLCLVPKTDVRIIDEWNVVGLRGTGSKDVVIEDDVFVPSERAPGWFDTVGRNQGLAVLVIAGPGLGAAEAAIDVFRERMAARVVAATFEKQSETGSARKRFAESAAEVRAARLLLETAACEIDDWMADGRPTENATARWVRDTGFAAELCTRATNRLFEASGGGALHDGEPIQRLWRDVNAGHAHAFLSWDGAAETWAKTVLAAPGRAG